MEKRRRRRRSSRKNEHSKQFWNDGDGNVIGSTKFVKIKWKVDEKKENNINVKQSIDSCWKEMYRLVWPTVVVSNMNGNRNANVIFIIILFKSTTVNDIMYSNIYYLNVWYFIVFFTVLNWSNGLCFVLLYLLQLCKIYVSMKKRNFYYLPWE